MLEGLSALAAATQKRLRYQRGGVDRGGRDALSHPHDAEIIVREKQSGFQRAGLHDQCEPQLYVHEAVRELSAQGALLPLAAVPHTTAELAEGGRGVAAKLQRLARTLGKPVLLTEIGYTTRRDPAVTNSTP